MRSVLPRAGRRGLLNGRRDGHSGRLEHLATTPLDLAPEQEPLPVLLHLDHLQPVQITDHIGPLQVVAPLLQSGLQLLAEHQRQERAEHVQRTRRRRATGPLGRDRFEPVESPDDSIVPGRPIGYMRASAPDMTGRPPPPQGDLFPRSRAGLQGARVSGANRRVNPLLIRGRILETPLSHVPHEADQQGVLVEAERASGPASSRSGAAAPRVVGPPVEGGGGWGPQPDPGASGHRPGSEAGPPPPVRGNAAPGTRRGRDCWSGGVSRSSRSRRGADSRFASASPSPSRENPPQARAGQWSSGRCWHQLRRG